MSKASQDAARLCPLRECRGSDVQRYAARSLPAGMIVHMFASGSVELDYTLAEPDPEGFSRVAHVFASMGSALTWARQNRERLSS